MVPRQDKECVFMAPISNQALDDFFENTQFTNCSIKETCHKERFRLLMLSTIILIAWILY